MRIILLALLFVIIGALRADSQAPVNFTGTIISTTQRPVGGATIHLLNSNRSTVSDKQGNFIIKSLTPGRYTIEITAIGFAGLEREIVVQDSIPSTLVIELPTAFIQLDAVLVSAQKTEEFLQQVPFSVTALSARQIQQYRIWNSRELTAIVPNLYSSNPGDNRNVTSIRGITTTSYDPAVATYIDGVNQFGLDTYIAELLEVERIEVLRGPQGTLYGRNAMGGVINIITKQPANTTNGFAELTVGNKGAQRYSAGVRVPLVKDKLFLGIAGLYDRRRGFYTNEFDNSSFDDQHRISGNYDLKYMAGRNWSFRLNLKHQNTQNEGAFPLVNGKEEALAQPFLLNQDAVAQMIDNTFNTSLTASYAGAKINFTSQTSYQSNRRVYNHPLDGDFSPIDGVTVINDFGDKWNKVKVITQEFRFTSPASQSSRLKWTAGSYFFYQNNPAKQAIHFGNDAVLVGAPDINFSTISSTTGKNTGWALFGQGNYAITERLEVIAGIRYDNELKKYQVLGQYQKDPDPTLYDTRPDTSASVRFNAFSPKLGADYKLGTNSHVYVTYSRGYRTGGLTQLSSDPSQPPLYPYDPEYSNNIEAGSKNVFFGNRFRLNLALFIVHINNAQVPTLVLPDAITVTRNAGKLRSKGIELEMAATPSRDWQLDYSFGYTDAEYRNLKLSQNGSSVDLSGKKQLFTPDITSMLAVQYNHDFGSRKPLRLIIRGEWSCLGKQYFDLANTISQTGYQLWHTRFGIALKHFEFMFWTRNLGDKKFIAYAYDFGAVHLGDPRTYGLTCTFRY